MSIEKKKVEIKWIILAVLLICFICLAIIIKKNGILEIDKSFYNFLSLNIISERITPFVKALTELGGVLFFVILAVASLIFVKNRKLGLFITLNIALSSLVNKIVKHIIQRERPIEENRLIEETGFSFPSGHSMTSMAFYGFMIYLINRNLKNRYIKVTLSILLSALIILIGLSRVYLGVHYITDVLGAFILAISFLIIFISVYKKLTK